MQRRSAKVSQSGAGASRLSRTAILLAGLVATAAGCYPGDLTGSGDPVLVITRRESAFDFRIARTWAMPDTVLEVCGVASERSDGSRTCPLPSPVDHAADARILATVASRMSELGYVRVPLDSIADNRLPDVVVQVTVAADRAWASQLRYDWWTWWGWWPGWTSWPIEWSKGWFQTYPCCLSGVLQWEPGTVFVEMVVPGAANTRVRNLPTVWTAMVENALPPATGGSAQRAIDGVTRAFAQSASYLETLQ